MLGTDNLTSATPAESAEATSSKPTQVTTSKSEHKPSTRAGERWAYRRVDRRLKVISVLLPVGFILAAEFVHYMVEEGEPRIPGYWGLYRPISVSLTVVSILAFALVMFRFIDRAQEQVVRQNRELAATNAVSTAVQGQVGVDRIIDVVLESVLTTSGAAEASVTIFSTEDRSPDGAGVTRRRFRGSESVVLVPDNPGDATSIIDFPLSTGAVTVGRMQLRLPLGAGADDRLASGTLQNIGHQLASAIQLAQLVADLQRRKHEGHAFYDVLLQISNLKPPLKSSQPWFGTHGT